MKNFEFDSLKLDELSSNEISMVDGGSLVVFAVLAIGCLLLSSCISCDDNSTTIYVNSNNGDKNGGTDVNAEANIIPK